MSEATSAVGAFFHMSGITKSYPMGDELLPVLKGITLDVQEGEHLSILGPSGSGKSTLMNIIGCLDTPTSGTYLLDGEDLSTAGEDHLSDIRNRSIGFVFQNYYLLPKLSALDNVALPLLYAGVDRKERRERAAEALERIGLGDRKEHQPNQLSGGQCQRVAIARAMINHPRLLLADEPTGALDSASGEQIMDIFTQLNAEGTTVVLITHEQSVADCARSIRHILDGRLTDAKEVAP